MAGEYNNTTTTSKGHSIITNGGFKIEPTLIKNKEKIRNKF